MPIKRVIILISIKPNGNISYKEEIMNRIKKMCVITMVLMACFSISIMAQEPVVIGYRTFDWT